ncbi:MAG TPA: hypothetical protein VFG14_02320 [Chthoniobacteraceae bacterium]|jgi:hypothetical protein|nr:hypothetical protein [Chthoniobacteraceae bacterium]
MPLSYEIDEEQKLLTIIADDRLTYDDVIAHQKELLSEPRLKPGLRCLVDLTGIKTFAMSGRDMFRLAQVRGEYPYLATNARTAIVVKNGAMFAMARMYALSRRKYIEPMAIFYSLDEARQWLLQEQIRNESGSL